MLSNSKWPSLKNELGLKLGKREDRGNALLAQKFEPTEMGNDKWHCFRFLKESIILTAKVSTEFDYLALNVVFLWEMVCIYLPP